LTLLTSVVFGITNDEQTALCSFIEAFPAIPKRFQNWKCSDTGSACKWGSKRISCNSNGNVISVTLPKADLAGELPGNFGDLQYLKTLDLSNNPQIVGSLPESFSQLADMNNINLANTSIGVFTTGNCWTVPHSVPICNLKNVRFGCYCNAPYRCNPGACFSAPTRRPSRRPSFRTPRPSYHPTPRPSLSPTEEPTTLVLPNNCYECLTGWTNTAWCLTEDVCVALNDANQTCPRKFLKNYQAKRCPILYCYEYTNCRSCTTGWSIDGQCGYCVSNSSCIDRVSTSFPKCPLMYTKPNSCF